MIKKSVRVSRGMIGNNVVISTYYGDVCVSSIVLSFEEVEDMIKKVHEVLNKDDYNDEDAEDCR